MARVLFEAGPDPFGQDGSGRPTDRDSSSYIATFEPASTFAGLVEAEGIRRGAGYVCQLTILRNWRRSVISAVVR